MTQSTEPMYVSAVMEHYLDQAHDLLGDADQVFELIETEPIDICLILNQKLRYITAMIYVARRSVQHKEMKVTFKDGCFKVKIKTN
ncbi:MAG: hypothetical protein PHS04_15620 [Tissierellia bacterium]|nr:hypothetical protein [Tissierellia bacterium]